MLRRKDVYLEGGRATVTPAAQWLDEFSQWMVEHRGVGPRTLGNYCRVVKVLLTTLGSDPARYTPQSLRQFVADRARPYSRVYAKEVATSTRMFVRYLACVGACPVGLEEAIPRIACWPSAALPKYVPASDVQRIVDSCNTETPIGVRDRAVLLLLARLGLRAGEVAALCFEDIDWEEATLRVAGKSRRQELLPLQQEVGDALLAYLERGRPVFADDHVFLRVTQPPAPLKQQTISGIVSNAIGRAGVKAEAHGAHLLRHSLATQMLRSGNSLREIASVLRHRSLQTTTIYAKVDVALLKLVAQPWPEVPPC